MPFQASWIKDRLTQARDGGRLGHAYLLTGHDPDPLEDLAWTLAAMLIGEPPAQHPDVHCLRPESKSRRITIEQVRTLERDLRLKAYRAPLKVALVFAADRMCIGSAEPANAFLKTLEEPPDHCTLILTTVRPDQLLPTLRSRCLALPVASAGPADTPESHAALIDAWISAPGRSVERAYRRAGLLLNHWQGLRDAARKSQKAAAPAGDLEEKELEARAEAHFNLQRDESVARLIRAVWEMATPASQERASRICHQLEEMRHAISRNVDPGLSAERCHLAMEVDFGEGMKPRVGSPKA